MSKDTQPRAHYLLASLHAVLPYMTFQVYSPRLIFCGSIPLYVFGFLTRTVLIGGYLIAPLQVEADLELNLLHASLFFHTSWASDIPRFYPEVLRDLYEAHRAGGLMLRRVA
jgi:hypothetical protein